MLHHLFGVQPARVRDAFGPAHDDGFRDHGEDLAHVLGAPPLQYDVDGPVGAVHLEGAPEDLEQVAAVRSDEVGDVTGEELRDGEQRNRVRVGDVRGVRSRPEGVEDRAFRVAWTRPGIAVPRLVEEPPLEAYVGQPVSAALAVDGGGRRCTRATARRRATGAGRPPSCPRPRASRGAGGDGCWCGGGRRAPGTEPRRRPGGAGSCGSCDPHSLFGAEATRRS